MNFDIRIWCESALLKLSHWLNEHRHQMWPYSVYAGLSAATIVPLVEEAARTGQLAPVVGAIFSVASGIGANLVANQVEAWKNRAAQGNPPPDSEIAAWISQEVAHNAALRDTFDAFLEEFAIIARARDSLQSDERRWFLQTLQQELQALGNLPRFETIFLEEGAVYVPGQVAGSVTTEAVSTGGDFTGRDKTVIIAGDGATVIIGNRELPPIDAVNRDSAVGQYLQYLIAHTRYLQLQGIRSGGRLVHIELAQIYITLRTTRRRTVHDEEQWLNAEAVLAPGERRRLDEMGNHIATETVTVSVNNALSDHRRLVVLGDPGSGKTTLLRYLALIYARDMAEKDKAWTMDKLGLAESDVLPILVPLRQIGAYLRKHYPTDDGTLGHKVLLDFLYETLHNERLLLPDDFFDAHLHNGKAIVLLDGMDEVPDTELRGRVARLLEAFVRAYPLCRYVITSRIVGYVGTARLGEAFVTTTVRDFSLADVERFLNYWHYVVAISDLGVGDAATVRARRQTEELLAAIRNNERIRELAINPLMLTVIALVHRDRVKLPDRRAELYVEAVDVLLGKWDEARGVRELPILGDQTFDAGDKRLVLQSLALHMHEARQKEIEAAELSALLKTHFAQMVSDEREAERAIDRFLRVIAERAGLLVARGQGVYAFSHLTFQEYLAALAIAARDDYVRYTLAYVGDSWWREVILLEAGHLSIFGREKTTRLITAIAEKREEPEPYHNLVLATECLRDVGPNRVDGDLSLHVSQQLRQGLETPPSRWSRWFKPRQANWIERRSAVVNALVRVGAGYWTPPYGEPEWIEIPAGKFMMGDGRKCKAVFVAAFCIARVPITNAQYDLFVRATNHPPPPHWEEGRPPKELNSHPVIRVSWHDAVAYCDWLSQVTGKKVALPTEEQWEKAARGDQDTRAYPWGDAFERMRCNTRELGIGATTPVGIFPRGASPYGVLDMSGNVWEWTQTRSADGGYWLRGGSWDGSADFARVSSRYGNVPVFSYFNFGFRVAAPVGSGS